MNKWRSRLWLKLIILTLISCIFSISIKSVVVHSQPSLSTALPPLKIHTLPKFLANWQDTTNSGDYFSQIKSTYLGYLIWSSFPVKIFIEQPQIIEESAANQRFGRWVETINTAIAQWNIYFPLQKVNKPELADIIIKRSIPEREITLNTDTGLYDIPRAITAQTNYSFYLKQNPPVIAHRMTIVISPNYTGTSLLATVRHELGHALGIWGHSPLESDALYFSQVSNPPAISPRDLNTLKKIYQQPTKLGWHI
ncbi:hypothetical protein NIES4102_25970 [Chondrocystis sp. NIES-4102]|nr:hypothetical protein NIES4102_25970 [Chondrocystis sp. NIES-4102]